MLFFKNNAIEQGTNFKSLENKRLNWCSCSRCTCLENNQVAFITEEGKQFQVALTEIKILNGHSCELDVKTNIQTWKKWKIILQND